MKNYIEFDEFGVKELFCMRCGTTVGKRTHVPVENKDKPGEFINAITFKMWSNSRRVPVKLEKKEGQNVQGRIHAFLCVDCEKKKPDLDAIESQVHKGFELGMQSRKETDIPSKMEAIKKLYKLERGGV